MQSLMGSGFCQLQPFTKRQEGENAVLAILLKCIFNILSSQISPDGALLKKQKYIKTMQHSCEKYNGAAEGCVKGFASFQQLSHQSKEQCRHQLV